MTSFKNSKNRLFYAALSFFFIACDPGAQTAPEPQACVPGSTQSCACVGGGESAQICNSEGAAFGPCICADAGSTIEDDGFEVSDVPITDLPLDEGSDPGTVDVLEDIAEDSNDTEDVLNTDEGGSVDEGFPPTDAGLPECDPPLMIIPQESYGLPFSLIQMTADGGTGAYRFELVDNQSGSLINPLTGDLLVGQASGVQDVVRLRDLGCEGSFESVVNVVLPMNVAPNDIVIGPGLYFTFEVTGGSGVFGYEVIFGDGEVDSEGVYVAPNYESDEQIQVLDLQTGQIEHVDVSIRTDASFVADPPFVFLPTHSEKNHTHEIKVKGGSGYFDIGGDLGGLVFDGTKIRATEPGLNQLVLTDQFTGQIATLDVMAVAPQDYPAEYQGPHDIFNGYMRDVGDLNLDGFTDFAVSYASWSEDAFRSGAVYIYAGSETGLLPDPVRTFSGEFRDDFMGQRFLTDDFNEDGIQDIAIGVRLSDLDRSNAGAVYIYYGVEGEFFPGEPAQIRVGEGGSDQFGRAMTSCDFNGDGHVDLAVGADQRNDPNVDVSDTGAVYIFLGTGDGLSYTAAQTIYGRVLNSDGEWWSKVDTDFGFDLSSGYIDDDGRCDLVVYMNDTTDLSGDDGSLQILRGKEGAGFFPGGVEMMASVVIGDPGPLTSTQYIGRSSVVGDVDGDGLDDVVVGTPYFRNGVPSGSAVGSLHLYSGANLTPGIASAVTDIHSLPALKIGTGTDYVAQSVQIGDFDGQPPLDIISGDYADEDQNGGTTGLVRIYLGQMGGLPTVGGDHQVEGDNGGRLGFAVAIIQDADGDFLPDVVAVAERDDSLGYDAGRIFFYSGADILADPTNTEIRQPLNWNAKSGGQRFGSSVALAPDFNNDGNAVLAVGAPLDIGSGFEEGSVFVYSSPGELVSIPPAQNIQDMPYISASDYYGESVAADGDFDGDGLPDLAVVARVDHRPGSFPTSTYYMEPGAPTSCTGGRADVGSLSIYKGLSNGSFSSNPVFVFFGPELESEIRQVRYAGDTDGDGRDDILLGSYTMEGSFPGAPGDDEGAFMVVKGRMPSSAAGTKISVICDADFVYHGHTNDIHVGYAVAGIGDVNGDGCDDFAVGAEDEDVAASNQGSVRVFFGMSQTRPQCPDSWTYLFMAPGIINAHVGQGLDGGHDVDGDGIPDMAVGGWEHRVNAVATGGVWLVSGAYIASLQGQAIPAETGVAPQEGQIHSFAPFGSTARTLVEGDVAGERFGYSVALAPGIGPQGTAAIVVGRPLGALSGTLRSGGASIYIYEPAQGDDPGGLKTEPTWILSGESAHPEAHLGWSVDAISTDSHTFIAVGALYGESDTPSPSVDTGSTYVLKLPLWESP